MPQPNHDPRTPEPFGNSPGSFYVDLAKAEVPPDGSPFWPCKIEKIKTLTLYNLEETGDLRNNLPGFPDEMTQLESLTIFASSEFEYDPTTGYKLAPFPSSLRSLIFGRIPLLEPFSAIKTLTHFSLYNQQFAQPLDILLEFLEQNHSLKRVVLYITSPDPFHCFWTKAPIKLNKITYLEVNGTCGKDIEALIKQLDPPASVEVVTWPKLST